MIIDLKQPSPETDLPVRRIDRSDNVTEFVLDLGDVGGELHTDVVDDTVIVVHEQDEVREMEFEIPEGEARTFIKNGVLTIEVEQ